MFETLQGISSSAWILMIILGCVAVVILAAIWAVLYRRGSKRRYVLVDGSNVMYWRDETPDLTPVKAVIDLIRRHGAVPVVWFDANVGYLIWDRYRGDQFLATQLGLPSRQVNVAPKGTPADQPILEAASLLGAQVVTNDKFRDWVGAFPFLRDRDVLVGGRYGAGRVQLRNWPPAQGHEGAKAA